MPLRTFLRRTVVATIALLSLCLLCGGIMGCAEERDPINRIQANALAKSFFVSKISDPDDDPEFYMRVTVVDVAAGANHDGLFTSSDAQPTTRSLWLTRCFSSM